MAAALRIAAALLLTLAPVAGLARHAPGPATQIPTLETTVRVSEETGARLVLRFSAETADGWDGTRTPTGSAAPATGVDLPALGYRKQPGNEAWSAVSSVPASFSVLVAVPGTGRVEHSVLLSSVTDELATASVSVSQPAIMRDLRVVRVTFTPPLSGPRASCSVDLALAFGGGAGVNEKTRSLPLASPAFARLYKDQVLNYEPDDFASAPSFDSRDAVPEGARYLIISADTYLPDIAPLAEWRNAQGLLAKVVALSTIGSTSQAIHDYVQNAYDTWDVPPEYVLLVGDTEQMPGHEDLAYTDNYYATMEGEDVLADILVGRISADTHTHCQTQVAKILGYERTPVENDPNWPLSATMLIADDNDTGDWVYYDNTWYIYDLMENAAFAPIDTLFDKNDVSKSEVYASINNGAGFVNFRGQAWYNWPYPFDLDTSSVTTGWRLPVVVSATCGTGMYETDGFMCELWVRAGSATTPKGGVAFFATNTAYPGEVELALRRGYVDEGFFGNVFSEDGLTLGEACAAGKMNMFKYSGNEEEYEGWNLLGDPAMSLWSGAMREISASHDLAVQPGHTDFAVTVMEGRSYVEGALVACVKGNETYSWGYTDALGEVTLSVDPVTEGEMTVTVTARNAIPCENTVAVVTGPLPVLSSLSVDDSSGGNGDGYLSPGETAVIASALLNIGDAEATSVQAVWRTQDSYVTIVDSVSSYPDIMPDSLSWANDGFEMSLSPDCPPGHRLHYSLRVSHSGIENVLAPPAITIDTGRLSDAGAVIEDAAPGGDGSGTLSPGETVGFVTGLTNDGPCDLSSVHGTLTSSDPNVVITVGSAFFGNVPSGTSLDNEGAPFVFSVSPSAPSGHGVPLSLELSGDGGYYSYTDTLSFTYQLTGGATMLPSGPDGYGYYVYDQTDGLFGPAPTYDWFDIAPPGPGALITDVTDADAGLSTFGLFWNFDYYGETFNQVSVNSNGFLTMGWTDYRLGDNSAIPDPLGPQNMIAPFWDDLDPSAGGDVYKWLDTTNHRWIIQFDHVRHWGMPFEETFQVIFLHPTYYPTPTGDGQILMQYEQVSLADGCTVGLENGTQDDGIQCLYDGQYSPQTAPIQAGSALLLTTIPPTGGGLPWLLLTDVALDDSQQGNGNGRAEPGETVSLSIELTNEGGLEVEGISLALSSSDDLASISDGAGTMSDLAPGGSADNSADPFTLTVSEAVGDTVATLWATISGDGYQSAQRVELHIDLSSTSVSDEELPSVFRFHPCHPNPFADGTSLRMALPTSERVAVRIYNVSGRLVRTLVDARLPAGERTLAWDGRNDSGARCASGVYLMKVEAGRNVATRKAVLLR